MAVDDSFDPPIRRLGEVYQKEFIVVVDGEEQYRGYFWSFVSSLMRDGVMLYDVLGVIDESGTASTTNGTPWLTSAGQTCVRLRSIRPTSAGRLASPTLQYVAVSM